MSLTKQLIPDSLKFSPSTPGVNWTRIETLIHGPGASDVDRVGADGNSAVFACLDKIGTSIYEPPLMVYRKESEGKEKPLKDHTLMSLFEKPTPANELNMLEILYWTEYAKHTDGNAYWLKVRAADGRTGNVVELWPVSPTAMRPHTEKDSGDWITRYELQVEPGVWEPIPLENVIHFRSGVDPKDMRKGISRLKLLLREIATDEEASKFTTALLKNYAVPGLIVIPATGGTINPDDADRIRDSFNRKFGNDQRGNTAVLSKEATVHPFGFSPEELNLGILRGIPEERISAVMGVPAVLVGLGAGLENATYSNARELREMFAEEKLVPEWNYIGAKLTASLLPDFDSNPDTFVAFDITSVRALQEDEDRKYARLNIGVQGMRPWITVNEARSDVGLPPVEGGDELQTGMLSPFGAPPRRDEGDESGDEENVDEEQVTQRGYTGGANGQDAPFPGEMDLRWQGYP